MLPKLKLKRIIKEWYENDKVAEIIYDWIRNREVMGRTIENKVERPLKITDPNDIKYNGYVVSYHATQERFSNEAHYEGYSEEANVISYDITIDIDCNGAGKVDGFELSKQVALYIIDFLNRFDIKPVVKFSGRRGFHIIFPHVITNQNQFLYEYRYFIHKSLLMLFHIVVQSKIGDLLEKFKVEDTDSLKQAVAIDVQLASPRHMIRVPYSIHEGTGLVSTIIRPNSLKYFDKEEAYYTEVEIIEPRYEIDNAGFNKIILLGLSIMYKYLTATASERYLLFFNIINKKTRSKNKLNVPTTVSEEELYPPCVKKLLQGVEPGMRNNTMFFLIHFFKKLGKNFDEIQKIIYEWNERNKEPLKEREVDYALKYHWEHDYMPYSCTKIRELFGQEFCQPDEFCTNIKNPIQYPYRKLKTLKKTQK